MTTLPSWTTSILRCPSTSEPLTIEGQHLVTACGTQVGLIDRGIVRIPVEDADGGIAYYRKLGGAHFHERANAPFAMSSLDTPVYHHHLRSVRPGREDAIVVDVGGGDGRNAWPWLREGAYKLVVIDAAGDALLRFRARIAAESEALLDRVLLIEADARALPLASGFADTVFSVETLCFLNETYEKGLDECCRILGAGGSFMLSERDYECGLLMRLLYHGIEGMLDSAKTHYLWDGAAPERVRTRCFTERELIALLEDRGLKVDIVKGLPAHSLLIGWLNHSGSLALGDKDIRTELDMTLKRLAETGSIRRSHVLFAQK